MPAARCSASRRNYFVTHNLQGDVTAIYNAADSTFVGTYTYDPWGRVLAVTAASSTSDPNGILTKNPFRYRGYYYDAETGFYYLNSRYYDPETCRFINADLLLDGRSVIGYNLFAYCVNDPVNQADSMGLSSAIAINRNNMLDDSFAGGGGGGGCFLIAAIFVIIELAKNVSSDNSLISPLASSPASPPGPNRDDDITEKIRNAIYSKEKHIFSDKHKKDGILELGNSQNEIMNKLVDIASKTSDQWVEGSNEIRTVVNSIETTIRFYYFNGNILSIDAYVSYSNRMLGNIIYYLG